MANDFPSRPPRRAATRYKELNMPVKGDTVIRPYGQIRA